MSLTKVQSAMIGSVDATTLTGIVPAANGGTGGTNGAIGFKNRLINGNMVIDQRNAGASVTLAAVNPQYTLDRWCFQTSQASKISTQQNAGSVTPPVGFTNYLGVTSLSSYSVNSTDFFDVQQRIEGYNFADLGWGTANAKTITLSFWVYSSLTGTFGGALSDSVFGRSYPFSYSIPTANTWTQISITIAGSTSGTWVNTTGNAVFVFFSLGCGSTYAGTAGSWVNSGLLTCTGETSVVGTNGATWYVTGVQLEVGTAATNFDFRSIGTELQLCYRYYYYLGGDTAYQNINTVVWYGSGDAVGQFSYPATMRAAPSIAKTGNWATLGGGGSAGSSISNDQISTKNVQLGFTGGSGGTSGQASTLRASNDTSLRVTFSAEL